MRFEKEVDLPDASPPAPWRRRALLWGLLLLVVIAAGAGWLWHEERETAAESQARRAALDTLGAELSAARTAAAAAGLAPEEEIRRLEQVSALQQRLAALQPASLAPSSEEMQRTEKRLAQLRADLVQRRSEEREQAALGRLHAGDTEQGVALLREALKLQREANASSPERVRNFDREQRLQEELARLTAEPLVARVAAKTAEAKAALADARHAEALAAFREARQIQEQLNREFPRTRYSDLAAISRLEAEIAALTDEGLAAEVESHLHQARRMAATERVEEAVRELVAAAEAQRQLNERFGKSRFVSMSRLEEIEAERQTLLAREQERMARAKQREAVRHLRRRQIFQAQQAVREGLEIVEGIAKRFPKARDVDDGLRVQFGFLNLRSADLGAIQDPIYEQLAPLGTGARAMLKTEVLQADFAKLMSSNPSRNPGRTLPVDSVTFPEAEEFCRRLGWVLGWRVRLPTEEEMRQAAGTAEFQDVNGRLEEWIASAGGRENPAASVWAEGGRAESAPRTERVRTRGFRVVVEVDLALLREED